MEFRLLGPLEVEDRGRLLRFRGRNERALLAFLLLHADEVVSRERLIEVLWRGQPPTRATHSLETYISRLRKTIGGDGGAIEFHPAGYRLRIRPEQLDLHRFEALVEEGWRTLLAGDQQTAGERLAAAQALWRSSPFPELSGDPDAEIEAARLEELRLSALEGQVDAQLAVGRDAELVGRLQTLVAAHPLREGLQRRLMLALYRSGRQAEALEVYQDARRRLVDQLGLEPSKELQQLQQAILAHAPELELAPLVGKAGEAAPESHAAPRSKAHAPGVGHLRRRAAVMAGVVSLAAMAAAAVWVFALRGGEAATMKGASTVAGTSASWEIATDTTLTRDHYGEIAIVADNVTLDCGGHRVIPSAASAVRGILIRNHRRVTVIECVVGPGFKTGVEVEAADGNTIRDNTSAGNENDFGLGDGSSHNTLTENTASEGIHGFWLVAAAGNVLTKNTISGAQVAFQLNRGADGNMLSENRVTRGVDLGFLLLDANRNALEQNISVGAAVGYQLQGSSTHNLLRANSASGSGASAYRIEGGASRNTLSGNQASDYRDGFALERVSANTLTGNQASRNASGFVLSGSTGNRLTGNRSVRNGNLGFSILDGSDANTFANNTAEGNSGNGFWIQGSSRNRLLDNTAKRNGDGSSDAAGFLIESVSGADANGSVLRRNQAAGNNGSGFLLHGHGNPITGTTLDGNTASHNSRHGFAFWRADETTWTDNTAIRNGGRGRSGLDAGSGSALPGS